MEIRNKTFSILENENRAQKEKRAHREKVSYFYKKWNFKVQRVF